MFAKVSKKGQITIPKPIRKKLNIGKNSGILFVIDNDEVKIKGVPAASAESLAGSLKEYASNYVPLKKIRTKIQPQIAREAESEYGKKGSGKN
jgi:AbrB family looped-hinge helix DNA binding protein